MIKVRHFKGGVYTVYAVDEKFVYYGDVEQDSKWKREFFEFLSLDARSKTGNRLDFVEVVNESVNINKEEFLDVTDGDKDTSKINVDLFRKIAAHVQGV